MDSWIPVVAAGIVGVLTFYKIYQLYHPHIYYDIRFILVQLHEAIKLRKFNKRKPAYTVVDKLIAKANEMPNKVFLKYNDELWTYKDVNQSSNRIARVFREKGVRRGDAVAIMMSSQPLFVTTWFGVAKTAGTSALINTNLKMKPLLHCINISQCKHLIVSDDDEILNAVNNIMPDLEENNIKIYIMGKSDHKLAEKSVALPSEMDSVSENEVPISWREDVTMQDDFCLIYTSGTTGVPKAARGTYFRMARVPGVSRMFGYRSSDVIYCPLPLYHTSASAFGMISALEIGATLAIRKKFSASAFWNDCRKHNATAVLYIGETMHYVCKQPPNPNDRNHKVRLALGVGLRPNVWKEVLKRFGDIKVVEFYGATEGILAFINFDNTVGKITRLSPFMKKIFGAVFVKYDIDVNQVVRDENGRCIETALGEPGLLLCKIRFFSMYHGYYRQKKLSEKKVLKNVLQEGDQYFNTGDILLHDKDYYVSFVDRTGDTFRWKGENVSTNEVADVIREASEIEQVNVYGVTVADKEGKCGMMSVTLKPSYELDCKKMYNLVCNNLASYAQPKFIRVVDKLELTGTWKLKKTELVAQGYDLGKTGKDQIYVLSEKDRSYIPLTSQLKEEIENDIFRI